MKRDQVEDGDALEHWIAQAGRSLSSGSRASVRAEIQEHYELSLEEELHSGVPRDEAVRRVLASLGDAEDVNRGYREALLTRREARALCVARFEAGMARRHVSLKAAPLGLLAVSVGLYLLGKFQFALIGVSLSLPILLFFAAQFLPLHTRRRSQVFRILKYAALGAMYVAAFPLETTTWISLVVIVFTWVPREWLRASLRRKLPEPEWPETLYN